MNNENFTTTFLVDQTPKQAFDAVNNVRGWWTENVTGDTHNEGDEFSVQFWDIHYSKQRLIEVIPDTKVVWLVTESKLTFIEDQSEWTGQKIIFEINKQGDKTEVRFTQQGLEPSIECYADCSNAWNGYIQNSLQSLITTGVGKPTKKDE